MPQKHRQHNISTSSDPQKLPKIKEENPEEHCSEPENPKEPEHNMQTTRAHRVLRDIVYYPERGVCVCVLGFKLWSL